MQSIFSVLCIGLTCAFLFMFSSPCALCSSPVICHFLSFLFSLHLVLIMFVVVCNCFVYLFLVIFFSVSFCSVSLCSVTFLPAFYNRLFVIDFCLAFSVCVVALCNLDCLPVSLSVPCVCFFLVLQFHLRLLSGLSACLGLLSLAIYPACFWICDFILPVVLNCCY